MFYFEDKIHEHHQIHRYCFLLELVTFTFTIRTITLHNDNDQSNKLTFIYFANYILFNQPFSFNLIRLFIFFQQQLSYQ